MSEQVHTQSVKMIIDGDFVPFTKISILNMSERVDIHVALYLKLYIAKLQYIQVINLTYIIQNK